MEGHWSATFIARAVQQCGLSAGELVRDPGKIPANFHPFHYLDGVDGQVAQGATDEKKVPRRCDASGGESVGLPKHGLRPNSRRDSTRRITCAAWPTT